MKLSTDQEHQVANWNPRMIYTWTKAMVQKWYDDTGSFGLYDGQMWDPVVKSLGVGRYEVTFKIRKI